MVVDSVWMETRVRDLEACSMILEKMRQSDGYQDRALGFSCFGHLMLIFTLFLLKNIKQIDNLYRFWVILTGYVCPTDASPVASVTRTKNLFSFIHHSIVVHLAELTIPILLSIYDIWTESRGAVESRGYCISDWE